MALFSDDDFTDVGGGAVAGFPFLNAFLEVFGSFRSLLLRFFVLDIIVFTVYEHYDVGILFNRAGFTKI